jgi:hypothetical protein
MITYYLTLIALSLVNVFITPLFYLPNATIDPNIGTAITQAGAYLSILSAILPINTLLAIFAAYIVIEAAIFAYKLIMWVIKKIPTIN